MMTPFDETPPHISSTIPPSLPRKDNEPVHPSEGLTRQGSVHGTFGQSEELRCVIAIIRHGDRTPKQKVVLKVTEEKLLNLMLKYNGGKARSETKLETVVQLQDLLDVTRLLEPRSRPGIESEAEDIEHAEKLRQIKAVLEEGGCFSGIYRKVQLKPLKWIIVPKDNGKAEEKPVEALLVLTYGGVLTHSGRKQAEELGIYFRNNVYPGEGTGLLRLHCTNRHELKIYSSDEGCVQMSAAAFAKGLLDLEGEIIPILVSLVSKDGPMLDEIDNASIEMDEAKARLNEIIKSGVRTGFGNGQPDIPCLIDGAGLPHNASQLLPTLVELTKKVTEKLKLLVKGEDEELDEASSYDIMPPHDKAKAFVETNIDVHRFAPGLPCGGEGFLRMYARWRKLGRDLFNERNEFDITQIPDVYDSSKYDVLHNSHLNLEGLTELFDVAQVLANGVIPNKYGINPKQKLHIGSKIAQRLLSKILIDLRNTREEAISVAKLESNQDITCSETEDNDYLYKTDAMIEDRISGFTSQRLMDQDEDDVKETKYGLDPKYANVKTPRRHVRTHIYFTSESHIHSMINVLRYCNMDETLQVEDSLVCDSALDSLFKTKELDYMSYIVLRMFENTELSLEDPKRFRIEKTYSRGADLSHLVEATSLHQEHTLPIMVPESLQEVDSCLTLEQLEKILCLFSKPVILSIPPDMIFKILTFLPVKSLLRFRCVSKGWNSRVSSPDFIKEHLECSEKNKWSQKLILRRGPFLYSATINQEDNQINVRAKELEVKTPTFAFEPLDLSDIAGSCRGMLCIGSQGGECLLWNPYTGQHVDLPHDFAYLLEDSIHFIYYAVGYDQLNDDYKVVRVVQFLDTNNSRDNIVMIYSLNSDLFERVEDFPHFVCGVSKSCVNGALHYVVREKTDYIENSVVPNWKIASFDITYGSYRLIPQPNNISYMRFGIGELGGCLCIVRENIHLRCTELLIMKEYGVGDSWIRLIRLNWSLYNQICFLPITYWAAESEVLIKSPGIIFCVNLKGEGRSVKLVEIFGTRPYEEEDDDDEQLTSNPKFDELYICNESLIGIWN